MKSIKEGARQAVENCLKIQKNERAVIITDTKTHKIAFIINEVIKGITGNIQFFIMENFGKRPLAFPELIGRVLRRADVSLYIAQGTKGELQIFRRPMLKIIEANKKLRHAHMVGITSQIMKNGMCSDYQKIRRVSKFVYRKVKNATKIKVTSSKGTNLRLEFNPKLRWKISDGDIQAGDWNNLPDGEVFTSPDNVNGRIVIDGCLGDFFVEKYGLLESFPVTIDIEKSRANKESIECDDVSLKKELINYLFETDKNSNKVGEFAIGTNIGLTKLIGNLLQDEKFPGIHIAFGSPYPNKTGAGWDSKVHLDAVIKNATIYIDGDILMRRGRFLQNKF